MEKRKIWKQMDATKERKEDPPPLKKVNVKKNSSFGFPIINNHLTIPLLLDASTSSQKQASVQYY